MDQAQAKFEGWAVVEMMGHQREVGFVTTEVFGAACLFRIDTPGLPEREYELPAPEWVETNGVSRLAPKGAKVKREASPARSKLVGPPAIYAITPCTEETALKALERLIHRPLILLEVPDGKKLLALDPGGDYPDPDGEDEEQDEDEGVA